MLSTETHFLDQVAVCLETRKATTGVVAAPLVDWEVKLEHSAIVINLVKKMRMAAWYRVADHGTRNSL